MTESLIQAIFSNTVIALILALFALASHYFGKKPVITHALWLLVLVKLITPPIFTLPILSADLDIQNTTAIINEKMLDAVTLQNKGNTLSPSQNIAPLSDFISSQSTFNLSSFLISNISWFMAIWLAGSAVVLGLSLWRINRFNLFLKTSRIQTPIALQDLVDDIADQLNLNKAPSLIVSTAKISPMVWWTGGEVKIVLPEGLIHNADESKLQWIVAHELVHVKRRDHMVRWLELLASVCCWWNPLTWWARRNLRIYEELCCDNQVLSIFQPKPKTYANALMTAVEYLASANVKTPAVASGIGSDGSLERRFRMIISTKNGFKVSRWLSASVIFLAVCLLPLGIGFTKVTAQESNPLQLAQNSLPSDACRFNSNAYSYLVDQVHSGELSGAEALARWEQDCGPYQGAIHMDGKPLNVAHHLWRMANTPNSTEQSAAKVAIDSFECDEPGYEYLVDLVHGKTISAQQGIEEWESQCGEYSGERIDKAWKKFDLPRHHLKYMAENDSMSNMPASAKTMWQMYRKFLAN